MSFLQFTTHGIYCTPADFYIDPLRKVPKALITHGHSDHARKGMGQYLCSDLAKPTLAHRMHKGALISSIPYGKVMTINGVKVSFHPAGHIIGSSQIRLEYQGEVVVISGDYKIQDDGLCQVFEPVPCHTFITESTFGIPIYHFPPQASVFEKVNQWWAANQEAGRVSVLMGYSLGKSQRILKHLDSSIGPIYCHGSIHDVNEVVRAQGFDLPPSQRLEDHLHKKELQGSMILCPPGALRGEWVDLIEPFVTGACSGWTASRRGGFGPDADQDFLISDHADWEGLNLAVKGTGAERVYVTHGYDEIFSRWLNEQGISAQVLTLGA